MKFHCNPETGDVTLELPYQWVHLSSEDADFLFAKLRERDGMMRAAREAWDPETTATWDYTIVVNGVVVQLFSGGFEQASTMAYKLGGQAKLWKAGDEIGKAFHLCANFD